jgi:hypothetical protein
MKSLKGISSSFMLGPSEILVEPGDYHIKFTYEWPIDTTILQLRAHMHEYGSWFAMDWTSSNGTKRILEVEKWKLDFVNGDPPGFDYDLGEFEVSAGDTFTTQCKCFNPTKAVVVTPDEMCNTIGVALMDEAIDADAVIEVVKE